MNDEHDLGMSGELLLDPGSSYRLEVWKGTKYFQFDLWELNNILFCSLWEFNNISSCSSWLGKELWVLLVLELWLRLKNLMCVS
jgi:hypothetical protein